MAAAAAVESQAALYEKEPCRTSSLGGHNKVHEIWNGGHARRIHEVFRMGLTTLDRLQHWLCNHTSLGPSRYISLLEKLAIFLYIAGHNESNRDTQEEYQHSGETISCCFNEVLIALVHLARFYITIPKERYLLPANFTIFQ